MVFRLSVALLTVLVLAGVLAPKEFGVWSQRAQAAGLVEADRARTLATELLAALLEED